MCDKYKSVPGFSNYFADESGVVYCKKKSGELRPLKPIKKNGKAKSKYMRVHLYRDGKMFTKKVHHVILETFVGPRPMNHLARHLNDVACDNRACNLCWGTSLENLADKKKLSEHEESLVPGIIKKAVDLGLKIEELSIITRWNVDRIVYLHSIG